MKLADLRKLAIRRQTRIRFPLKNGLECVITEKGVARVPALNAPPEFNLEEELAAAASFVLEPAAAGAAKTVPRPETVSRIELSRLTEDGARPAAGRDEHADD
jgi:hypothetical protein